MGLFFVKTLSSPDTYPIFFFFELERDPQAIFISLFSFFFIWPIKHTMSEIVVYEDSPMAEYLQCKKKRGI